MLTIANYLLQVTLSVARAVENFLYQCESCVTNSDESLRDNIVMRLESIITNLEKFMQYVGSNTHLHQLRSRAQSFLQRFQPFLSACEDFNLF